VRFFYLSCLKKLGPEVVVRAVPYLTEHPWYVTRNMLLLLGEYGARDQLQHIRPLLQHSHAKVRQEALKTCLLLDDRVSVKQITANLTSKNRQEALNAVVMCTLIDNRDTSRLLIRMLEKENLFSFDLELKRALVQTLAESGKPEALKSFVRILNRQALFHGRAREQLKIDIIKALVRYPRKQVYALLQEQARRGDSELAGQARQALERLEQEEER
jgi:HEAT repeat protein